MTTSAWPLAVLSLGDAAQSGDPPAAVASASVLLRALPGALEGAAGVRGTGRAGGKGLLEPGSTCAAGLQRRRQVQDRRARRRRRRVSHAHTHTHVAVGASARWSKKHRCGSHSRERSAFPRGVTGRERRLRPSQRRDHAPRHRSQRVLSLPLESLELPMWGGGRYFAQDPGVYSLACARKALGVDSFQCEQFQYKGKKGVSSYRISKKRLPKLRPRLLPSQAHLRRHAPRERGHEAAQAPHAENGALPWETHR